MRTKSFTFEVIVLFLLSIIPWPGPTVFKISCSRDSAKIVRKIVHTKWISILEKHQVKLPLECPFHPQRDIFGPQHAAKYQHRPTQWTCGFCGKSFYEEKYLDMHFDNRHRSKINKAEDAICLADYCDIMRCQVLISQDANLGTDSSNFPNTDVEIWQEGTVYRTAVTTTPGTKEVSKIFVKNNDQLSINPQSKAKSHIHHQHCPKPEVNEDVDDDSESRKNDSDSDQNSTSEHCENDLVDAALPPMDQKQKMISEIQKLKSNCKPEDLQRLKTRCEILVRDCIAGLIINLSVNDFKEIEEEMNRAVCWYLSCDRYWEDAANSVRPFPWHLVLGITTILTLAICMCYYIIWVLFDSDDRSFGSYSANATAHSSPNRLTGSQPGSSAPGAGYSEEYYTVADLNELGQNEHYIYVTYPPELKRRLLERYGDKVFTFLLLKDPESNQDIINYYTRKIFK